MEPRAPLACGVDELGWLLVSSCLECLPVSRLGAALSGAIPAGGRFSGLAAEPGLGHTRALSRWMPLINTQAVAVTASVIFPSRRHLTTSEDSFGCYTGEGGRYC